VLGGRGERREERGSEGVRGRERQAGGVVVCVCVYRRVKGMVGYFFCTSEKKAREDFTRSE
jgi:hypothetical protein